MQYVRGELAALRGDGLAGLLRARQRPGAEALGQRLREVVQRLKPRTVDAAAAIFIKGIEALAELVELGLAQLSDSEIY